MSVNASDTSAFIIDCDKDGTTLTYICYCVTTILLVLPRCVFVIYQWLKTRSSSSSSSSSSSCSHSDCFTYQLVALEMMGLLGMVLSCHILFTVEDKLGLGTMGYFMIFFSWYGEMFFHVLTCVERHLAVVHPITYLGLKGERGARIRNIIVGCVWLLCFGLIGLMVMNLVLFVNFCLIILSLVVVSFCSLSVLRVLIRAGPGKGGGTKEKLDPSKKRAFYTIVAILGALVVKFIGSMLHSVVSVMGINNCVILASLWFSVPSRLVLPLLYLNKAAARRSTNK